MREKFTTTITGNCKQQLEIIKTLKKFKGLNDVIEMLSKEYLNNNNIPWGNVEDEDSREKNK